MSCPDTNPCEDYPCCGHAPSMEADIMAYYCDTCGVIHQGDCPDDFINEEDDE